MSDTASRTKAIITIEQAQKFAPIVSFHEHERFFPCSIDWLLPHTTLLSKTDPSLRIERPSQSDLASHPQRESYLDIHRDAYHGQPLHNGRVVAPMYVAAQEWNDCIEITYVMLYANQGGQTCRSLLPELHFNAIVDDYGQHQGDLEWVSVLVTKDYKTALSVGYEAHGDIAYYPLANCMPEGNHPRVRAALNGHACRNPANKNPNDWDLTYEVPSVVATIDLITAAGPTWNPHTDPDHMLKIIGLDEQGTPISDQVWAKFAGRLGAHQENDFRAAYDVSGGPLPATEHAAALSIIALAKKLNKIPESIKSGEGPEGPGARDFVNGQRRHGKRLWQFTNTNTDHATSAAPFIVTFQDKFHIFYRDGGNKDGVMHIRYNGSGWEGGKYFHAKATTSAAPFAIEYQGRLHLFLRDGGTNDGLMHYISDEKGEEFHGANPFHIANLRVAGRPSAAILNGKLTLVGVDGRGRAIQWADYHPERPVEQRWDAGNTGFDGDASPSIVAYQNKLHVFYKDGGGNNGLMHIVRDDDGKWRAADVAHPDYTTSAGPYALVTQDQLHIFFRDGQPGSNGILHIASNDGNNFQTTSPSWNTGMRCDSMPSAAVLGNTLRLAGRNFEGNAVMCSIAELTSKSAY